MACKVDRAIREYGLTGTRGDGDIDAELLARWTGEAPGEAQGYRALTEWFNRRLLKQVYDANGRDTVGTRVESDHAALTGDDDLLRQEVVDDLAGDGIDGAALADAMVSWSTMRHHLKGCLDGEKPERESRSDWERRSVEIATEQAESKLASAVGSLTRKGRIAAGDEADLAVEAYLSCPVCGLRVRFAEAVERGYVCPDHLGAD